MAGGRAPAELRAIAQECHEAARALKRAPAEVKKATKLAVRTTLAEPLARAIGSAAGGPWGRVIGSATKSTADVTPRIKIGGARRVVSGGASVRQLAPGTEWGGGRRVTGVTRRKLNGGSVSYRRRSTAQFKAPRPFIYPTIDQRLPALLEDYADVVADALQEVIDRG